MSFPLNISTYVRYSMRVLQTRLAQYIMCVLLRSWEIVFTQGCQHA